jgi:hypothetical protein
VKGERGKVKGKCEAKEGPGKYYKAKEIQERESVRGEWGKG